MDPQPVTMLAITQAVAMQHGLRASDLMGESVNRNVIVPARHEAMWRIRQVRLPNGRHRYSYVQIGRFFKRNHTTVIHACKRHARRNNTKALDR